MSFSSACIDMDGVTIRTTRSRKKVPVIYKLLFSAGIA